MSLAIVHRPAVLAAALAVVLAACTSAAPPAGSSQPSTGGTGQSPPVAPTSAITTPPSAVPPSPPPSAAPPSAIDPAPAKAYDCGKLVSDAEMQQATTLANARLINQELWTDTPGLPEGETHCGYEANGGAIVIEVTVATGVAFTTFEAAEQGLTTAPGMTEVPGIGDRAVYVPGSGTKPTGAARRGGTLVIVVINDLGGNGLTIDAEAAITQILKTTISRV